MKWIVYKMDDWGCTNCRCPECWKDFFVPDILLKRPDECPNCGAKNEEVSRMKAMIHSKNDLGEVEVLKKVGDNDYLVKTEGGVTCHAIFNPFVCIYYADDLYAVEKEA